MSDFEMGLRDVLESLSQEQGLGRVRQAAAELARAYASGRPPSEFDATTAAAYAAMRLPGTLGALAKISGELALMLPPPMASEGAVVLDTFAGPATAALALVQAGVKLQRLVCVERDPAMRELGATLTARTGIGGFLEWYSGDVRAFLAAGGETFDIVVAAYGLGEVEERDRESLVGALWRRCRGVFLIVEPGTPAGARLLLSVRQRLLAEGATIWAPCPHEHACPLEATSRWCHFATRVPRSRISRLVDGAQASYEDEKFSYLVAGRYEPDTLRRARLVAQPRLSKAEVALLCCTPTGRLTRLSVARRDRTLFRRVRKLRWGDSLPDEIASSWADHPPE